MTATQDWLSAYIGSGHQLDPDSFAAVNQQIAIEQEQARQAAIAEQQRKDAQAAQDAETARQAEAIRQAQLQQAADEAARIKAAQDAASTPPPPTPAPNAPPDPAALEAARVNALAQYKGGSTTGLSSVLPADYQNTWLTGSALDKPSADILAQNRQKADDFIANMVKRGVITDTGAAAARKNLDDQAARVSSQIGTAGKGLLTAEQSALSDIRGRGLSTIGGLQTGDTFDPTVYQKQAQDSYNAFISSLPNELKSRVGTDLFDTSQLPSIAGSAQGAQNLPFDPAALSGGYDASAAAADQQKRAAETAGSPRSKLGASVF